MHRFRLSAGWRLATVAVCFLLVTLLSGTSVWTTALSVGERALGRVIRTVAAPSYGLGGAAPMAPSITASMVGNLAVDNDSDGKADPNDTIRYTTTITNSGADDATGVNFSAIADAHTTLSGTYKVSPLAINESYTSVGNMTLASSSIGPDCSTPLRSVTCNDTLNGATLTRFGNSQANAGNTVVNGSNTVTTVNLGTVTLSTNGTFIYNPAAGFEGNDEFWYTLTNSTITPNLTDTGKVTITVGGANGMVWFVDSTGGGGTGRQSAPFNTLNAISSVNNGIGTNPANGDTIYLLENAVAHSGQLVLRDSQRLLGQDAITGPPMVATLGGPAPQPGNAYTLNSAGSVSITGAFAGAPTIVLGSGNTLAGFTVGHTNGAFAIFGTTAGTVSVRQVTIGSTGGGGLGIGTSASFVNDATFTGFSSITATGGTNGILLGGLTGTFTVNTGALSGATGSEFVVSGGSAAITFNGTITQNTAGQRLASISNTTGGSVLLNNGGANAYVSGGTGILLDGVAGTFFITGADLNGTKGIEILGDSGNIASGTYTINNTTIDTTAGSTNHAFIVDGDQGGNNNVTATVNLNNVDITNPGGLVASIQGMGGGAITFDSSSAIVRNNNGLGISATSNGGGTVNFNGSTKTLTTTTNAAVSLVNNTGTTFNFVNGNLDIDTTSGAGFTAAGGGTVTVQGSNNSITSTTGTALNVSNTTIGASGLAFVSISASGATNGVVLNNTGSGPFTVAGNSSGQCGGAVTTGSVGTIASVTNPATADCTGGTIQASTGGGVSLNATGAVSLTRMRIINGADDGITASGVAGLTLTSLDVENNGNADEEHGMDLTNVTGSLSLTNSTILGSYEHNFKLTMTSGTLSTLTVTGSAFRHASVPVSPAGGNGLLITTQNASVIGTGTISDSLFRNNFSNGLLVNSENTSTIGTSGSALTVSNSSFDDNNIALQCGLFHASSFSCRFINNTVINDNRTATSGTGGTSQAMVLGTSGVSTGGSFLARVAGNVIGNASVDGSGSSLGSGIRAVIQGLADSTITITGNTIRECPVGFGMDLESLGSTSGTPPLSELSVTNNNVDHTNTGFNPGTSDFPLPAIYISGDNQGTAGTLRTTVTGNTVPAGTSFNFTGGFIELFEYTGPAGDLQLLNTNGSPNATAALTSTNTGSAVASSGVSLFTGFVNTVSQVTPREVDRRWAVDVAPAQPAFSSMALQPARLTTPAARPSIVARAATVATWISRATNTAWSAARAVRLSTYAALRTASHTPRDFGRLVVRGASSFVAPLYASGETVTANIGTLPAGKSITVVFTVTVDTPPVASYSTSATISSTTASFSDVTSNTVTTTGDRYNSSNTLVSSANPSDQLSPVTFTATVATAEGPGFPTPDGTVQFMDGAAPLGSPVTCNPKPGFGNQCTADLITSSLFAGPHSITANYLGGTNYDPSTSTNTISQVVNACTVNPVVTANADSGAGSLRQAIADACAGSGNNVISFNMGTVVSPITLTTGELAPTRNVVITGPGAKALTITRDAAASPFRIFHVGAGRSFAISGVTVSNGLANAGGLGGYGGGLFAEADSWVTITAAAFTGNTANEGGGAAVRTASLASSLAIVDSTISGNTSNFEGGGVLADSPFGAGVGVSALAMTNTTVSGNVAGLSGGGVTLSGTATGTITNSTIASNTVTTGGIRGGGMWVSSQGLALLRNTIVANNTEGSGGSIIPSNIVGALAGASSNNVIGSAAFMTGITGGTNGNQVGVDPLLGPLADNGGPTRTHALLQGSPAIDAGDNTFVAAPPFTSASPITDQRGIAFARILDGADADTTRTVDIGAVEANVTVEDITAKTTAEDTVLSFSFNVGDGFTAFDSIVATTSDPAVVTNAGLSVTGGGSTRTLAITPTPDASGTATVTVTATRTILGVAQVATDTFLLTVTALDDAPTLDAIANPAAINEDAAAQGVSLSGITAGGGESQPLTVTAASNNTALVPNPTVTYTSPATTGSLSYTPVADANGSAVITVTVGDGVTTFSRTFTVTVTAVNDAPTLDPIADPAAILEGAAVQTVNLAGIATGGGESQALTVTATSSNTALVPNPAVSYTSPNATGSLSYTPVPGVNGTATITVTVMDNGGGTDTVTRTFLVSVTPVDDAPTLDAIADPAPIAEDAGLQSITLAGITAGAGDTQGLTVTATSSNTALIPNPAVTYTSPNGGGSLSYTPVADANGSATITVTVTDSASLTVTRTFTVVVTAVNDTPTIAAITNRNTNEDTATGAIGFTVGDVETAAAALTLSALSSNTALVPVANIVFGGAGANRTVTLMPAANQSGTATITIAVSDGVASATSAFVLTVDGVNDVPTMSPIADQATNVGVATGAIPFTVADVETAAGSLSVSGASTNTTLVPNANIIFGGSGASRTVTVTPAAGQAGTSTITVTVTDGVAPVSRTFLLTVGAPAGISTQPQGQTIIAGETAALSVVATGTAPLSYQWYAGASGNTASPVAGATSSAYTTPALTSAASYWVRVSNPYGAPVNSATAAITVQTRVLSLIADLRFGNVPSGNSKTLPLLVLNEGDAPLTVTGLAYPAGFTGDWAGGTLPPGGVQSVTVTFSPTAITPYAGVIVVTANQTSGANSIGVAGIGTGAAPVVTAHPQARAARPGNTVTFSAAAVGKPTPTVQWQVSADGGTSWTDVAGATATSYTLTVTATDIGRQFRALFTNADGSAATTGAALRDALRARADFDGDGLSDLVVWRGSTGTWYWLESAKGYRLDSQHQAQWGSQAAGDIPKVGDVDGDGKADIGVWRPSLGTWFWLTSSSGYNHDAPLQMQWGSQSQGDVPLVGDMDGDGQTDLLVWRASTGTWHWLTSSSGYDPAQAGSKQWGSQLHGDVPVVADIDGDGRDDLTVWRAPTGTWYWLTSSTDYNYENAAAKQWGNAALGDVPAVGDVDGDGQSDLMVWRASDGTWYWLLSSTGYSYSSHGSRQWGNQSMGDIPLVGAFDPTGRAALTLWRASTGTWYWLTPSSGYAYASAVGVQWGTSPDVPIIK